MKKMWICIGYDAYAFNRTLRIMKLSLFFVLVVSLQLSAVTTWSQNEKLTLKMENASIVEVLQSIEQQTGLSFFYQNEQLTTTEPVNVDVQEESVVKVLSEILRKSNLDFRIVDKHVVIYPAEENIAKNNEFLRPQVPQENKITGRVLDQNGDPIPGATVKVEGSQTGTITDVDGYFSLDLPSDAKSLIFSFVGMETQKINIQGQTNLVVTLKESVLNIDEVVVVGYGIQKKSDLTGAVTSVKGEKLSKIATSNPVEGLQGRMAGVSVTSIGGAPGGSMDIKIRGASTLNNNNPLVIIDGVPGSMFMLNPSDIASVEVLKDGAAAAIYGTEAANGVILITTKKGEEGDLKVNFSAKWASQVRTSKIDMANASQYLKVANMLYENAGQEKPPFLNQSYQVDTDWQEEVMRTAPMQEYNVSFSGGNKNTTFYLSGSWMDQEGTIIGSDFQKASLRSKIDFQDNWLKGGINISYNETERDNLSMSIREVYEIIPIVPVYDETKPDGFGFPDSDEAGMPANNNPVGVEHFNDSNYEVHYFSGTGYLTFDLFKGLNFRFEAGLRNSESHSFWHHPSYNVNSKEEVLFPGVYETRSNWREFNINNLLNYSHSFGEHSINLLAGYVAKKETSDWMDAGIDGFKKVYGVEDGSLVSEEVATGFLDEYFNTLDAGQDGQASVGGSRTTYTRASILGRLNYSYKNRYLLQATIRRDGSSKFGPDSRYGTFPSVALGWRISEESFLDNLTVLSNLKLRASYGVLGNENSLSLYEYMALMTTSTTEYLSYSKGVGESIWIGTIARDLENKKFRWETTKTTNIGFDFGFWQNKLSGSFNFYNNQTSDMLVNKPIPPSAGLNTPRVNFGEMKNNGVEVELTWQNSMGKLNYTIFGSLSTTHNEVTKLGYEDESIAGYGLKYGTEHFVNQTRVGKPLGAFFLYQVDGIFQNEQEVIEHNAKGADGVPLQPNAEPGDIRFKDVNNDGVINDDDKVYSGTPIPKYNYSFSFDADYKGFDFSLLLHGAGGHKIYNGNRYYYESMLTARNFLASTVNAWTPENKNTDIPRAVLGDPNQNSRESTRFLEKGDFLRIKNIQLGYSLPSKVSNQLKLSNVRFYISGQNLFTITDYSGQDPEVGSSNVLSPGLDTALYPISKIYLFGVQLSF